MCFLCRMIERFWLALSKDEYSLTGGHIPLVPLLVANLLADEHGESDFFLVDE